MTQVGTIKEIWRYPVKGMAGESLSSCELTSNGIVGDRVLALCDSTRAELQSCKTRPQLLRCVAHTERSGKVRVTFPDGTVMQSEDANIHTRLSALVGFASTLEPLRSENESAFYRRHKPERGTWLDELAATFDREPGEPLPDFSMVPQVLVDHVSVPGTFFLFTPMHLITTATLRYLQSKAVQCDWDIRRFRPNLVIETNDRYAGLAEKQWVGKKVAIGGASIECVAGTPRCGAVTRSQQSLPQDKTILRTIVKEAEQNLGAYAVIDSGGMIGVGDAVMLV